MKFTQRCGCLASIEVDLEGGGIVPILCAGAKPDDKGRVYRHEKWIEEWQALHAKCVQPPNDSQSESSTQEKP